MRNLHLKLRALHGIEAFRSGAFTSAAICEEISQMNATVNQYAMNTPIRIFNIDESGVSFKYMI